MAVARKPRATTKKAAGNGTANLGPSSQSLPKPVSSAASASDFEEQVRTRGGLAVMLGSDDQDNQTSLSGVDLYSNLWEHLAQIKNLRDHPYEFYQELGYTIVGVTPDANGWGKPDILMAKSVVR